MKYDFSGYATRYGVKCSDGRTIEKDAFKHQNGTVVPLLWNHDSTSPENVIGHGVLEHREDGLYVYGSLNDTDAGLATRTLINHDDIIGLSIHANKLKETNGYVKHGIVREVSLVLAGANPGAFIDVKSLQHSDDGTVDSYDGIIYSDYTIDQTSGEVDEEALKHSEEEAEVELVDETVDEAESEETDEDGDLEEDITDDEVSQALDVLEGLTPEQTEAMYTVFGAASAVIAEENGETDPESVKHSAVNNLGGLINMKKNVFDKTVVASQPTLGSEELKSIMHSAADNNSSLRKAFEQYLKSNEIKHADGEVTYGIEDIDLLFPDAKDITNLPQFVKRQTGWVSKVMSAVRKTPFARIKTTFADITEEEARARGYIKGDEKLEEVFKVMARVTTPQTVYKKQKLDRDDIIDITSFDVVAFVKAEMRIMFEEEIARSILVGDGRNILDRSKIKEENIRPIYTDEDFYSHKVTLAANASVQDQIEAMIRARKHYRGTGTPDLFTTADFLIEATLLKDSTGRFIYETKDQLAKVLRVGDIIEVEVMEGVKRTVGGQERGLVGIFVNLYDYTVGTDKGGNVSFFEDFDIDFNQEKYLMEARMSGALTGHKSALVIEMPTSAAQG